MADKIPNRSRAEQNLALNPRIENDVEAPPPDTLNAGATKLHEERVDYSPKFETEKRV